MDNGLRRLTDQQVNQFRTHGYLKLGRLLDDAAVELLRREYDREFELARAGASSFRNLAIDDTDDVAAKNEADEQMLQIMQMCERNLHFRRLLYHELILDCVEDLIGPNIQLFHGVVQAGTPRRTGVLAPGQRLLAVRAGHPGELLADAGRRECRQRRDAGDSRLPPAGAET